MRIAYFVNQYPKVSHSFIRREIRALERRGFDIQRVALRGWDGELVDAEDLQERGQTRYVLKEGLPTLLFAALRTLATTPLRFLSALRLAVRMGRRADRPLPYHLAYLAEACRLVPWFKSFGATHVHAHFGTNSAEVAMLARALGGPPYSFTVHGPEEFDKPQFLGIGEKIRRSAFVVAVSFVWAQPAFSLDRLFAMAKGQSGACCCGLEAGVSYEIAPLPPVSACRGSSCVGRLGASRRGSCCWSKRRRVWRRKASGSGWCPGG